MRSLGVIAARGGSKRLARKVTRPLMGAPLLAYAARAALASRLDRVVLSTEDDEIAALGRGYGLEVPFRRPAALAGDEVCNDEVVLHALDALERGDGAYEAVVLVQPTAPFVLPRDIDACLGTLADTDAACCFTAKKASEPPDWMFALGADGTAELMLGGELAGARQHKQRLAQSFIPNGAVWAIRADTLRATRRLYTAPLRLVVVEPERCVDIDEAIDLVVAEAVGRHFAFGLVPEVRRP